MSYQQNPYYPPQYPDDRYERSPFSQPPNLYRPSPAYTYGAPSVVPGQTQGRQLYAVANPRDSSFSPHPSYLHNAFRPPSSRVGPSRAIPDMRSQLALVVTEDTPQIQLHEPASGQAADFYSSAYHQADKYEAAQPKKKLNRQQQAEFTARLPPSDRALAGNLIDADTAFVVKPPPGIVPVPVPGPDSIPGRLAELNRRNATHRAALAAIREQEAEEDEQRLKAARNSQPSVPALAFPRSTASEYQRLPGIKGKTEMELIRELSRRRQEKANSKLPQNALPATRTERAYQTVGSRPHADVSRSLPDMHRRQGRGRELPPDEFAEDSVEEDDEGELSSDEEDPVESRYLDRGRVQRPAPAHTLPPRLKRIPKSRMESPETAVKPEDSISVRGSVQVGAQRATNSSMYERRRLAQPTRNPTEAVSQGLRSRDAPTSGTAVSTQPRGTPKMTVTRNSPIPEPVYERERPFAQHAYYDDLQTRTAERGLPCCCCE